MTFDESMAKVGTYLKNNDLSNSENNDRFFYTILNDLRQEYAPTIEMTKEQDNYLKSLTTDVSDEFNEEELPTDGSIKMTDKMIELDDSYLPLRYLNAIFHPETIKIIDE